MSNFASNYSASGNVNIDDVRIRNVTKLPTPLEVREKYPVSDEAGQNIRKYRRTISRIMHREDDRLLCIVGPCSIHDVEAGIEYAHLLKTLADDLQEELYIVMRVYFEKPRTSVGWKGLINDPNLDGSFDVNKGLYKAREFLSQVAAIGLPAGTEFLDLITPQYISDFISWGCIGARTTESQLHREVASGLSCPIGFKNPTSGDIDPAINAMLAARQPHCFMSTTREGEIALFHSSGNGDCHVVLRGGSKPNYDTQSISSTGEAIRDVVDGYMPSRVLVDCSHSNSQKDYRNQALVLEDIAQQLQNGQQDILGVMMESFLVDGRQNLDQSPLEYGKSITDACLDFEKTRACLEKLADVVRSTRNK